MIKTPSLIVAFFALVLSLITPWSEAKTLDDLFLYSTVFIQNHSTAVQGTGFVVNRQVGKKSFLLVLVSNRHVLQPKQPSPKDTTSLAEATVSFNVFKGDNISRIDTKITLRDASGRSFVNYHPDGAVDVAAIIVTPQVKRISAPDKLAVAAIPETRFATKDFIKKHFISPGDAAVIIGYPDKRGRWFKYNLTLKKKGG